MKINPKECVSNENENFPLLRCCLQGGIENDMVVLKNESRTLINEKVHAMDINQRFMGMTKVLSLFHFA